MTHRVLTDGIASLRGRYLFLLAHLCHVTPPQTWDLGLWDFARLIDDIDEYLRAREQAGG